MENEEERLENLRIENEVKKIKLSLEHGMNFNDSESNKLPPDIENSWLNHIQQFEKSFAENKRILVYDLIGKPSFIPINEIPQSEIRSELEKMEKFLRTKGIVVDTICDIEDSELYRFITEELFQEETDDMIIEDMTHHFIYEEFYPNHAHDIETNCYDLIESLLDKNKNINPDYLPLASEINSTTGIITTKALVEKIELFRASFSLFNIKVFKISSIEIKEENAIVNFEINYSGTIESTNDKQYFSGNGILLLRNEYDYWCINKIDLPGIIT